MIVLNDAARARFNELATDAVALVRPGAVPPRTGRPVSNVTVDERDVSVLSAEDIVPGSLGVSLVTYDGKRSGLYFEVSGTPYGLEGEAIERVEQLLQLLARQRRLHEAVGPDFLRDSLRDWLKARLSQTDNREFSDWLLDQANSNITSRTVVVPLVNFKSESPFDFGGVRFDHTVITRALMDALGRDALEHRPDDADGVRYQMKRLRRQFQGHTCGIVTIEASRRWAEDAATERVDRALHAIRLFSPSAFVPGFKAAVGRLDQVFVPATVTGELVDGSLRNVRDGVDHGWEQTQWLWRDTERAQAMSIGLAALETLLLKDSLTELDEAVLLAVKLLDESVCCNALQKRAALALTAAESLLLQNDSEPITTLLGLRCGHLVRSTAAERLALDATIKRAYELRSGYVHHGRATADVQVLSDLHVVLLDTLAAIARLAATMKTKADLFKYLQSLIWS